MARRKNKIFDQSQAAENAAEDTASEKAQCEISDESQQKEAEAEAMLLQARQRIQQLEEENKKLKEDNDQLLMKLAEMSASLAERPAPAQQPSLASGQQEVQKPVGKLKQPAQSKNVNYSQMYRNNGYGTWH